MRQSQHLSLASKLLVAATLCSLLMAAYVALGIDEWEGASRSPIFLLIFLAIGFVVGCTTFAVTQRKSLLLLPGVYMAFILVLPLLNNPAKAAHRIIDEIRPGMDESEVRAVIDRHFPRGGPLHRPDIGPVHEDRISFNLDPNDGRYNAALVQIQFAAGKCVGAEFLAD
jgi:hypothetical protein